MDEEHYLAVIAESPTDLDLQAAYADWLAPVNRMRSDLLRSWVEITRTPMSPQTIPRLGELKAQYRDALVALYESEGLVWLQRLNQARWWIGPEQAEKFVRVILARAYGAELAATWPLRVSPAVLDDRWTVEPVDSLPPEPGTGIRAIRFFSECGSGDISDVAS
jgi:uncharacterized protein (TIGR02996 family)